MQYIIHKVIMLMYNILCRFECCCDCVGMMTQMHHYVHNSSIHLCNAIVFTAMNKKTMSYHLTCWMEIDMEFDLATWFRMVQLIDWNKRFLVF